MKVQLHCHTSQFSLCGQNSPDEMIQTHIAQGYDVMFLTDHDSVWPADDIADLQTRYPEIRIFPGIEVSVLTPDTMYHVVLLGTSDEGFCELPSPACLLARARKHHVPTILAHPYRWSGRPGILEERPLPDAMEARSWNHDAANERLAIQKATQLDIPLVYADDAHTIQAVGQFWIETHREFNHPSELREVFATGAYEMCQHTVG
jgi:predicted metal-dependent phosphoesterase TrpH